MVSVEMFTATPMSLQYLATAHTNRYQPHVTLKRKNRERTREERRGEERRGEERRGEERRGEERRGKHVPPLPPAACSSLLGRSAG